MAVRENGKLNFQNSDRDILILSLSTKDKNLFQQTVADHPENRNYNPNFTLSMGNKGFALMQQKK